MRLSYHPGADAEITAIAQYYDANRDGLGEAFLDELERVLQNLLADPLRWPRIDDHPDQMRRCQLRRFPYSVCYQALSEEVRIMIVRHHARHPDFGRGRV
jgi:plasmid stabilization system protein ParE